MGCKVIRYKLSLYMDDQLGKKDIGIVEAHLDQCPDCREYDKVIRDIKGYCNNLEEKEMPLGFHAKLQEQLYKKGEAKVLKKRRGIHIAIGVAAALVVIIIGVGMMDTLRLGRHKSGSVAYDMADTTADTAPAESPSGMYGVEKQESMEEQSMDMDMAEVPEESFKGERGVSNDASYEVDGGQISSVDRKIIKSAYLGIETLEFDVLTNNLEGKVSIMGGYIESSNIQGVSRIARSNSPTRQAHYEIRIPGKNFEQFISEVDGLGNLITKEIGGEDVTSQYFDTQARIKSLTIQEERLLSILGKAERLQDIIELESELSRVRYEIENYTGTLKRLDNMVNYSRVSLDVYEVKEIKATEPDPETLGERIVRAFKESLRNLGKFFEDLTIFTVSALPYLIIIIPLVWIILMLGVRFIKNRSKNKEEGSNE